MQQSKTINRGITFFLSLDMITRQKYLANLRRDHSNHLTHLLLLPILSSHYCTMEAFLKASFCFDDPDEGWHYWNKVAEHYNLTMQWASGFDDQFLLSLNNITNNFNLSGIVKP